MTEKGEHGSSFSNHQETACNLNHNPNPNLNPIVTSNFTNPNSDHNPISNTNQNTKPNT